MKIPSGPLKSLKASRNLLYNEYIVYLPLLPPHFLVMIRIVFPSSISLRSNSSINRPPPRFVPILLFISFLSLCFVCLSRLDENKLGKDLDDEFIGALVSRLTSLGDARSLTNQLIYAFPRLFCFRDLMFLVEHFSIVPSSYFSFLLFHSIQPWLKTVASSIRLISLQLFLQTRLSALRRRPLPS